MELLREAPFLHSIFQEDMAGLSLDPTLTTNYILITTSLHQAQPNDYSLTCQQYSEWYTMTIHRTPLRHKFLYQKQRMQNSRP